MIDINKQDRLMAEHRVCAALGTFINENATRCIKEHNTAECKVWIEAFESITGWLDRISNEYDNLINEVKKAKEEVL